MPEPVWVTSPEISRRMRATPSSDTRLDVALRRALTDVGLPYRLQLKPERELRYRSDFVFIGARVIVDARGCFWHACPLHVAWPRSNVSSWEQKLLNNRARDERMEAELTGRGWAVVVVWEHDDFVEAANAVKEIVSARRSTRRRSSF